MFTIGTLAALVIGVSVGIAELVARYKDEPLKAITSWPAIVYVLINGAASVAAFVLILRFGWKFGISDPSTIGATRVLVAGFGAMALFRSSLFTVRVGSSDVAIGPSSFLAIILVAADRAVDRVRAEDRAEVVAGIIEGITFAKSKIALPLTCFALMQNVPNEEQQRISREIEEIDGADVSDYVQMLSLGLTLMNVVGEQALESAIAALGDEIKDVDDQP